MSRAVRILLFAVAGPALAAMLLVAMTRLPPAGHYAGPYGDVINANASPQRHVTDTVAAVTYDYRGFDTMIEELILFASVIGVAMLLRGRPDERELGPDERRDRSVTRDVTATSDAVRAFALFLVGICVVFGLYLAAHGQVSPGGGFQAGVILATAPLIIYLAQGLGTFERVAPHALAAAGDSAGVLAYVLVGTLGFAGGSFLQNVLPLGTAGQLMSSGTILSLSIAVGLAVAGGFISLLSAFLIETLLHGKEGKR